MIEQTIFDQYGITVDREEKGNRYPAFRSGDAIYSIIPLEEVNEAELAERQQMSEHLALQGDRYVSRFILSKEGSYISVTEGQLFLLLENTSQEEGRSTQMGRKLAKFHHRARSISTPIKECSRVGEWKGLWEQRIDQLERMWNDKLVAHPNNSFEKQFIESFPYYMSLSENAIQYLVDTEIDDTPVMTDGGTVCYERFTNDIWSGKPCIKNPFDWVFDHGSRDIAEWTREQYFAKPLTHQPEITEFMNDYQALGTLSSFSARLLYSRLLFPIHYVETIEEYFSNPKESRANELEDKLNGYTDTAHYYEEFLKRFYEIAQVPARQLNIPTISWL